MHHVCTRLRSGTTAFSCLLSMLGSFIVCCSLRHSTGETFGPALNLRKRLRGGRWQKHCGGGRKNRSLLDGLKQSLEIRTAWTDAWPQLTIGKSLLCFCFPSCEVRARNKAFLQRRCIEFGKSSELPTQNHFFGCKKLSYILWIVCN